MPIPAKYKPTKYKPVSVRTSLFGGEPQYYTGKAPADNHGITLVFVEKGGKVYGLAPKRHYDSLYSANDNDSWEFVGEPYQSRRSSAQKARAGQGKLAPWEQKALDAKLLSVIREYRASGAGPEWLHEDLFNNHNWSWTRGDAEEFGGPAEGLSALASKATYYKPTQRSLVKSALARLKKAGNIVDGWNSRRGTLVVIAREFVA